MLKPLERMLEEFERVTILYFNPNIHPQEEYELRKGYVEEYAEEHGVEFVELAYEPALWEEAVKNSPGLDRCKACYALRMEHTARWTAQVGADIFATTLTISPYQHHGEIHDAGEAAARRHGVSYLNRTFVDLYAEGVILSKELGIYRQKYCGCRMSRIEAEEQRQRAAAEKRKLKAERAAQAELDKLKKQAKKERDRAHG